MGDRRLGAAVVGTGFGVLTHVRALRAAGFDVRALVGRDPERTRQRAADAGVAVACTSLAEALDVPGVDAVTIATPPHTHHDLVIEAVLAGKHVVCEKPFARDADEGQAMLAAATRAGVVHLLGTEFRWSTGQATAARAVAAGLIGSPQLATFVFDAPLLADPTGEVPAWWSDASQGGGWLGAYGSHVVDQMRGLLGEFAGLSASVLHLSRHDWSADDAYTVHFRTEGGATGTIQSAAGGWGPFTAVSTVVGTDGTLWIEGDVVRVANGPEARELPVPGDLELPPPAPPDPSLLVTAYDWLHSTGLEVAPYTRLFESFRTLIADRSAVLDPAPATFADGVAGQRVLDAIRRSSAAGGEWNSI